MARKTPLRCRETALRIIYQETKNGRNAQTIFGMVPADEAGNSPTRQDITNLWSEFGGKNNFLRAMEARMKAGSNLADRMPAEPAEITFTDKEYELLSFYRSRNIPWAAALRNMGRGELNHDAVRRHITRVFGNTTGLHTKYPPKKP